MSRTRLLAPNYPCPRSLATMPASTGLRAYPSASSTAAPKPKPYWRTGSAAMGGTLLASVIPDTSRGHGARLRPREARAGASSSCRSSTGEWAVAARQLLHGAVTVTYRPLRAMPRTSVNQAKRVRFARFGASRDAAWALAASAAPLFAPPVRSTFLRPDGCCSRGGHRSGGACFRRHPGLSLRVS